MGPGESKKIIQSPHTAMTQPRITMPGALDKSGYDKSDLNKIILLHKTQSSWVIFY